MLNSGMQIEASQPVEINTKNRYFGCSRKPAMILLLVCFGFISLTGNALAQQNEKVLPLEAHFLGDNIIYVTEEGQEPVKNEISFYIKTARDKNGKIPAQVPAEDGVSYIDISFEYGRKRGHLTKVENVQGIEFKIVRNYGNSFKTKGFTDDLVPRWRLTALDKNLFKGSGQNKIELKFSNIYTYLEQGVTTMHIKYGGIPGYQDGHLSLDLVKQKPKPSRVRYGLVVEGPLKVDNMAQLDGNPDLKGDLNVANSARLGSGEVNKSLSVKGALSVEQIAQLNGGAKIKNGNLEFADGTALASSANKVAMGTEVVPWMAQAKNKCHPNTLKNERIEIKKYKFRKPPAILTFLIELDVDHGRNLRIDTKAQNVTADHFTLVASTWANTCIYSARIGWIAVGE